MSFHLAAVMTLVQDQMPRILLNAGLSQDHVTKFRSDALWEADQRIQMRQTLDLFVYSTTEMVGLPRIDVPAEMVAAHIAALVSPINWATAAAWQEGLKPAKDLAVAEETVQVERTSAGRMYVLILEAYAAITAADGYAAFKDKIEQAYSKTGAA